MLKPSEFDKVDYPEEKTEQGNYCSCGVWVALPLTPPIINKDRQDCQYCSGSGECQECNGEDSENCEECFGTNECGACLGTGNDMEEEIEAYLLYRTHR